MIVKFKYNKPSLKRLGDGTLDLEKPQYEEVTGKMFIKDVFDKLNKEKVIWNLKIEIGKD